MREPELSERVCDDRPPRIVDLVFAGEPGGRGRRMAIGGAVVIGFYASATLMVGTFGRSGASIAAEMAARVHDAIAAERAVDVTPPPPPPPPAEKPPTAHMTEPSVRTHARVATAHHALAPPAQAGQLAAASIRPIDFTASTFVVGSGPSYAGGTTTSSGTNRQAVTGPVASNGTGQAPARSRARPVSLAQAEWSCPWPAEADALLVDHQTVVIRVTVRASGGIDHVEVLSDPGYGFGAEARRCALQNQALFLAARNAAGDPVTGVSVPIRVHFDR